MFAECIWCKALTAREPLPAAREKHNGAVGVLQLVRRWSYIVLIHRFFMPCVMQSKSFTKQILSRKHFRTLPGRYLKCYLFIAERTPPPQ